MTRPNCTGKRDPIWRASFAPEHSYQSYYDSLRSFDGVGIYHSKPWHDFLEDVFGWKVKLLGVETGDQLVGILPVVSKYRFLTRVNVSLPISHFVAPALKPGTDPEHFWSAVKEAGISLEVHSAVPHSAGSSIGKRWRTVLTLARFSSDGQLFDSFSKASIQRKINKAERVGYQLHVDSLENGYKTFNEIQAITRRAQGSPTFPRQFFERLKYHLRDGARLYSICTKSGTMVAGILFYFDDFGVSTYAYGASTKDRATLRDGVNQLAMWGALQDARTRGVHTVDFGTTPITNSGLRQYKEKWSGESSIIEYSAIGEAARFGIDRDGVLTRMAGNLFRGMPLGIFRAVSPIALRSVL